METFGKFMAIVLFIIISPIISGFVFVKLWGWFIMPTFGMHELKIVQAIGIILLFNFLKAKRDKNLSDDSWEDFLSNVLYFVLYSALALFFGWVIHLFM